MIKGPVVVNRSYLISEIPVFSKAGCIIPMRTNGFCKLNLIEFADFKNPFPYSCNGLCSNDSRQHQVCNIHWNC